MIYAKESEVTEGTVLEAESGFACLPEGATRKVHKDFTGLWIACRNGRHYIDGQLDNGQYIGLFLK